MSTEEIDRAFFAVAGEFLAAINKELHTSITMRMRNLLAEIGEEFYVGCDRRHYAKLSDNTYKKIQAVLAEPMPNYSRFTNATDAMSELKRIHHECAEDDHPCREDCPDCGKQKCAFTWLFASMKEGAK